MIDDIRKANESVTASSPNIAILRQHFPGCFTKDGTFDIEKFKELISDDVTIDYQGHGLRYLGQQYGRLLMNEDTTTVVVPNEEHNKEPENANSQNIFITGDNLDALKHLLHSYAGKVKLIYIDPPYNTGSDDFVYQDKFNFTVEELAEKLSISEEHAERILQMTRGKSSSHSAWLTFMEPRLRLARELLREDGVIFISIDDNEQANLRLLCDDIFGEENFEGHIHWRRRHNQPNDKTKLIGLVAEHILVYAKNSRYLKKVGVGKVALTGEFSNPDNDPRGDWASKPWKVGSGQSGTRYKIVSPTGKVFEEEWMGDEETFKKLLDDNRIIFPKGGDGLPRKKYFRFEREIEGQSATNWWPHDEFGHNQEASSELAEIFGFKNAFSNPKPVRLLDAIIRLANVKEGDIVLDFFAGSATTAHAVLQYSLGCPCHFIMVQLPESIDELISKASSNEKENLLNIANFLDENNRPRTLDQVAIERIIRVAEKIRQEHPDIKADLGFKHFILVQPSIETLDKLERFDPNANLVLADETILDAFGVPTVLTTWLVRDGYGLAAEPQPIDFKGYTGYYIGQHLYLIEPNPTEANITAIVDRLASDPEIQVRHVVLFGYSFTWTQLESIKTNLRQLKDSERNLSLSIYTRY